MKVLVLDGKCFNSFFDVVIIIYVHVRRINDIVISKICFSVTKN